MHMWKREYKYLYTIKNMYNGNILYPVGSSCITKFDRKDLREKTSLYEYLYKCIKEDILSGKIKANEKLPSKREMAKNHDISVITVENAYAQLIVEGYIYTKEKKGYFASDIGSQYIEQKPKVKYEKKKEKKKWLVDFNSNHIMYDSFPFATWSRIMRQTLLDKENSFLSVPEKNGVMELREAIADHLQHFRGMNVNPDNIIVGAGTDAVDYKLISICHKGDVVVSQDYGVAAMALGKGAYAIHQSGKWYTNENIDQMLMERHLNKKARRSSHKNHIKGPRKRTEEDDVRFAQSIEKLILMAKSKEGA
jgi:uncharacterized protein YaiI (UPF0178 family)/DNA-binding transcriptional regulator YhcF (GntR family)